MDIDIKAFFILFGFIFSVVGMTILGMFILGVCTENDKLIYPLVSIAKFFWDRLASI